MSTSNYFHLSTWERIKILNSVNAGLIPEHVMPQIHVELIPTVFLALFQFLHITELPEPVIFITDHVSYVDNL